MAYTLSSALPEARKLLMRVQNDMAVLEATPNPQLQASVTEKMNELSRTVQTLEKLVRAEPSSRQEMWQRRIKAVAEDHAGLRIALDRHIKRCGMYMQGENDRAELLGSRAGESTISRSAVQNALREQDSLQRSNAYLDDLTEMGQQTLGMMKTQRDRFKGIRRKVLDVANSLGMSSSILRLIERREGTDSLIVYGGIVLTLIFTFGLLYWVKSMRAVADVDTSDSQVAEAAGQAVVDAVEATINSAVGSTTSGQ